MPLVSFVNLLSTNFFCQSNQVRESKADKLQAESKMSNALKLEASTSAVLSECFRQNTARKSGQNMRNCDTLQELYIKIKVWKICAKDKDCLSHFK